MAHIKLMTDKPRTKPWRAHVHRKGYKPIVKMHLTKEAAERWARMQETSISEKGMPITIEALKQISVEDIVRRYLEAITPTKGSAVSESAVLNAFLRRDIAQRSLADFKRSDAFHYRDTRLKDTWRGKPITIRTVWREVNTLRHIWSVGREEWGYENLENPWRALFKNKKTLHRRKRRLKDGELEKLVKTCQASCRGLNRLYLPLAIYLAIETGMRLQEIFNLAWGDIDIRKRRIEIRKSKTDYTSETEGRTIVLTVRADSVIHALMSHARRRKLLDRNARIFPMTRGAFKQSWADVVKRAGITDLHFHDLRREAGSRFDEAELTKPERDRMLGHSNRDIDGVYVEPDLKRIQDKLDRHALGGLTYDEARKAKGVMILEHQEIILDPKEWARKRMCLPSKPNNVVPLGSKKLRASAL